MANEIAEIAPLSVFVTGATGALGREVVRRLKAAGHRVTGATTGYENAALVRADGGIPAFPDLMRAGEMRSVMQAAKADVVVNLAPQLANHLPQQPSDWNPRLLDQGVAAMLEAAKASGVKFVVHTSYAFADERSDELSDLLKAVKAGERKVLEGEVPGCVLRLGFVYGAGSPELVAARDTLLKGRMLDCGAANSHAAWINAPDAARAIVQAVEQRPAGLKVAVVEDQAVSPAGFLGYFAQSQGISAPGHAPRFTPWAAPSRQQAAVMHFSPHVTNAEAKEKLGWLPRFPTYQQGIDDVLLSWRALPEVAG
ncbi:MAG: NAD(P)-dependent oxidoreductase [Chloroflexota bacterium]